MFCYGLSCVANCTIILMVFIGMEQLAEHGYTLPPEMHGLTSDQIVELKLKDEHEHTCIPSSGYILNRWVGKAGVKQERSVWSEWICGKNKSYIGLPIILL